MVKSKKKCRKIIIVVFIIILFFLLLLLALGQIITTSPSEKSDKKTEKISEKVEKNLSATTIDAAVMLAEETACELDAESMIPDFESLNLEDYEKADYGEFEIEIYSAVWKYNYLIREVEDVEVLTICKEEIEKSCSLLGRKKIEEAQDVLQNARIHLDEMTQDARTLMKKKFNELNPEKFDDEQLELYKTIDSYIALEKYYVAYLLMQYL